MKRRAGAIVRPSLPFEQQMLRQAIRAAARLGRSIATPAGAALATAGRSGVTTLAGLLQHGRPMANTTLLCLAATTMGGSVAFAASNQERSFIMVKPDGVHRGLIGEIIRRYEAKGYKLVGIKVLIPSADLAKLHYAEHEGKPFFPKLVDFLTSGAVVAMVWEGKDVVKYGRTMIGATNPLASQPGTIRGDFGVDVGRNVIHGSDSVESAQREIALWSSPDELADYTPVATPWVYE